tara:strand:- start:210 stop:374 length:165 start_codon:yes stop_codon:yes gene_type:complete
MAQKILAFGHGFSRQNQGWTQSEHSQKEKSKVRAGTKSCAQLVDRDKIFLSSNH